MLKRMAGSVAASLALAACATPAELQFDNQRTVFNNPYVPPVIDQRGIGPGCQPEQIRDLSCTPENVIYPGRGRLGYLGDGRTIRLTRAERRFLRERAEALQARVDVLDALKNGTPLPPGSPALPPALRSKNQPAPQRLPPPTPPPLGPQSDAP